VAADYLIRSVNFIQLILSAPWRRTMDPVKLLCFLVLIVDRRSVARTWGCDVWLLSKRDQQFHWHLEIW
jgi:hypothetical protein